MRPPEINKRFDRGKTRHDTTGQDRSTQRNARNALIGLATARRDKPRLDPTRLDGPGRDKTGLDDAPQREENNTGESNEVSDCIFEICNAIFAKQALRR